MREISLTVASKEFTELVNEVEQGESFVITRRGRPIAKLTPHCADRMVGPEWAAASRRMMAFLDEGAGLGGLRANREEIYDRLGRFCLDTNILICAVGRDSRDPHEHRLAFCGAMMRDAVRRSGPGPILFVERPQRCPKFGLGLGPKIWEVPTTTLLARNRHGQVHGGTTIM